MKKLIVKITTLFFLLTNVSASLGLGQESKTQTIRGYVIDQDSKSPLIGATIIVLDSDPVQGTITDLDGYFRLNEVVIGRVDLKITSIGYEESIIPNILIGSGKEVVLEIELKEVFYNIEDVVIKAKAHKSEALNEMALVSAKVISVEETKRYAGSLNDPARLVSGYAGVIGNVSGNNDIIVRGNSSKGILWRLDGMEIPNPNHFSDESSTGGPINALNSAMLTNSDFLSGAFAPEYGNAFSGVFDMKLRKGNNEKREYTVSLGVSGLEAALEGPFSINYRGSYLINYRYSSLDLLDRTGIVEYSGVPKYQDISFKFHIPTKKAGTFQLVGFGGLSNIYQEYFAESNDDMLTKKIDVVSDVGFAAIKHIYPINDKTFFTSYVSATGTRNSYDYNRRFAEDLWYKSYYNNYLNMISRVSTNISSKIRKRHRIKAGITYSDLAFDMLAEEDVFGSGTYNTKLNTDDRAGLIQAYINWKYRVAQNVTMVSGIHYMQFLLNNSTSIEPRLGLDWNFVSKQTISFGFGLHSKVENIATSFATVEDDVSQTILTPNKDLGLPKSMHSVLSYSYRIKQNISLTTEFYYQYLYDLAVENKPNSLFVLNNKISGFVDKDLVNKGRGYNYGLELTLERFFADNYYFLITGSLYDSKFKAMDGEFRNSRFNGNYAGNLMIGKEWNVDKRSKNRTIGLNSKVTFFGGPYYTPVDLNASIDAGYEVFQEDQYYSRKGDGVFMLNLSLTYRRNWKKTTHEIKLDFQNVTNHQALLAKYYDDVNQRVENFYQRKILPTVFYIIQF